MTDRDEALAFATRYNSFAMKKFKKMLSSLFASNKKAVPASGRSYFDYSASEKQEILRAAGLGAQKDQQQLLKTYDKRFGSVAE